MDNKQKEKYENIKYGFVKKNLDSIDMLLDENMKLINQYTRRTLTADDVYIFPIAICNNDIDRDKEKITEDSLNTLSNLLVGKTVILDHEYKSRNQCARIFATKVQSVEGKLTKIGEQFIQLIGLAYTLNIESNKNFIDNIEAGILKEVSIGFCPQKCTCSICGEDYYDWEKCPHEKGKIYDGKEMYVLLENPIDAYEVSFTAVPAQAEAGVIKCKKEVGMLYNEKLKKYGITEDEYKRIQKSYDKIDAGLIIDILEKYNIENELKKQFGKDMTIEKTFSILKAHEEQENKIKAYDKIINDAIDNAIKNGVRAKGDNFNSDRWRKIFKTFEFDEIIQQSKEWEKEAKKEFNIGSRVSEPNQGTENESVSFNPVDYEF